MLTVHHMGISQSERIVWLCEELDLEYKLVLHKRAPLVSPDSLKSIPGNETGKAPFVEDSETGKKLSESAAICEYIIFKYGDGKLAAKPSDGNYWEYLYWVSMTEDLTILKLCNSERKLNMERVPLLQRNLPTRQSRPPIPRSRRRARGQHDSQARRPAPGSCTPASRSTSRDEQVSCWGRVDCRRCDDAVFRHDAEVLGEY